MSCSSISRAISILKKCIEIPAGISFGELKKYCGNLESSQLVRILAPLIKEEMITKSQVDGKYLPGNLFIKMAGQYFSEKKQEELIRPLVEGLAEKTLASAAYFEWDAAWLSLKSNMICPIHSITPVREPGDTAQATLFFASYKLF